MQACKQKNFHLSHEMIKLPMRLKILCLRKKIFYPWYLGNLRYLKITIGFHHCFALFNAFFHWAAVRPSRDKMGNLCY